MCSIIDRVYGSTDVAEGRLEQRATPLLNICPTRASICDQRDEDRPIFGASTYSRHRTIVRPRSIRQVLALVIVDVRSIVDILNEELSLVVDERGILKTLGLTGTSDDNNENQSISDHEFIEA